MNKLISKKGKGIAGIPDDYSNYNSKDERRAPVAEEEDEGPKRKGRRRGSKMGGINRNKFKQMKAQEAINDYIVGTQLQQVLQVPDSGDNSRGMEGIRGVNFDAVPEFLRAAEEDEMSGSINQRDEGHPLKHTLPDANQLDPLVSVVIKDFPVFDFHEGDKPVGPPISAPISAPGDTKPQPDKNRFPLASAPHFKGHDDYLRGITTFINTDTDLRLYKLDRSFCNPLMGVIGLHIVCPKLQEVYCGCCYMIRAYRDGNKIFEYTLGMHSLKLITVDEAPEHLDVSMSTIAWVARRNAQTFYLFELGA